MQKFILASLLISTSAIAQQSMRPDLDKIYPDDTTGEPVVYTKRVIGNVIGISEAIYESIPVQKICYDAEKNVISSVNYGTAIGGAVGAILGNQVGGGDGKTLATVAGGAVGAAVGNNMYQNSLNKGRDPNSNCEVKFVQRVKGYPVTIQSPDGVQMQGFSFTRAPRIGENFEVIIKSFYFAGQNKNTLQR